MLVSEALRRNGRNHPAKAAIVEGDRTITYAALDRIVDHVCHRLARQGVARGDLVGVALSDTADHLIVLLALARLGGIILPLDCRWSGEEKSGVAQWFEARWVIVPAGEPSWHPGQLVAEPGWFAEADRPYRDDRVDAETPSFYRFRRARQAGRRGRAFRRDNSSRAS